MSCVAIGISAFVGALAFVSVVIEGWDNNFVHAETIDQCFLSLIFIPKCNMSSFSYSSHLIREFSIGPSLPAQR
jgi:hypothetical protein